MANIGGQLKGVDHLIDIFFFKSSQKYVIEKVRKLIANLATWRHDGRVTKCVFR